MIAVWDPDISAKVKFLIRGSGRGKMGAGICLFRGWEMGFCALGTGLMKEKQ